MTPTPAEISPPHLPPEIFKDWLEEHYQGDAPFDREAAYLAWLTESKTLERLGECMVMALTPIGLPDFLATQGRLEHPHYAWREAIGFGNFNGASESPLDNPELYAELCGLFGVPAVFVEMAWAPPSPALAAAVLRMATEWNAPLAGGIDMEAFAAHAAMSLPDSTPNPPMVALRFRLGPTGDWHIRRL